MDASFTFANSRNKRFGEPDLSAYKAFGSSG